MRRVAALSLVMLFLFLLVGCANPPKPPPDDQYAAFVKATARFAAYEIAKNSPEHAAAVWVILKDVDPTKVLTYQQWLVFLSTIKSVDPEMMMALQTAVDLIVAYWGQPVDLLNPLQQKLVIAFVSGAQEGVQLALNK